MTIMKPRVGLLLYHIGLWLHYHRIGVPRLILKGVLKWHITALFFAFIMSASANQRVTIFCMQGGHFVVTNGVPSVTQVEQSYPSCTMTVYPAGSSTPVPGNQIFADNSGTVKGNPFNADATGVGFFYAANSRYDVVISGGGGGGLPAPYTIGDILLQDNSAGGTITSVTGGSGVSCNTVSGAVTCTNSGVVSFNTRTGAVAIQNGDVNFNQLAGSIAPGQIPSTTITPAMLNGVQGNGAKTQLSTGGTTPNDCVKFDANGNTIDAGAACGGSGTLVLMSTYDFTPQTPGGTLTAATPVTITLTPCPLGVAGTDTNHYLYIVGGTGTAEPVLITSGSCVSGGGSGTVGFTPANSHSGAWTIKSATAGGQEGVNVLQAAAVPGYLVCTGTVTSFAQTTITANDIGILGFGCKWNLNFPTGKSFSGIFITGTQGAATNNSTVLTLANRSISTTNTITVASTVNTPVGKIVTLIYDDGTYHMEENSIVQAVSGSNLTFVDPIVIPMQNTTNNVVPLNPVLNTLIKDIAFDCSGSASGQTQIIGVYAFYTAYGNYENLSFTNCNQAANASGLTVYSGYNNSARHIRTLNSGGTGIDSVKFDRQTGWIMDDIITTGNDLNPPGSFGIGLTDCVLGNGSNFVSNGNYARGVKLLTSGWNNISNANASNSLNATGFSVTVGSYANNFTNIIANNNQGQGNGIWLNGQDNEYNQFDNVVAIGNLNSDIIWNTTDINNIFRGARLTKYPNVSLGGNCCTDPSGAGAGNRIEPFGTQNGHAYIGCTGTATANTTIYINIVPPGTCTITSISSQSTLLVPTAGIVRNLRVTAAVGGVNGSSGVVTVIDNAVGTTGVTCTLGTGTSCSDTTHYYPVTAGHPLVVSVTTQLGETLQGLAISYEF